MSGQPIARIGDTISHGGSITSGSDRWKCEGRKIARVGDSVLCSIHGPVTITSGSAVHKTDGRKTARVGSSCSCGATVTSGSTRWKVV